MRSIYLFAVTVFLFSCASPINSEKEEVNKSNEVQKFNFEIVDVINHSFHVNRNLQNEFLGYTFSAKIVNKSGCKLSGFSFSNSIDLIFPKKTYNFWLESLKDGQYNPPWLANDTLEFDFSFDSWVTPEHLEYNPDTVFLYLELQAQDIIGNVFSEQFAIYDIMGDWVDVQSAQRNEKN
jgi:hypothetical protein